MFTKYELMELILSVHAIATDKGEEASEHNKAVEEIYNQFINTYDAGSSVPKEKTNQLLAKLINMLQTA